MKRFFMGVGLLAGLGLLAGAAQAQSGTVRGRVVDDKGQPMPEVKVEVEYQGSVTRKFETKTNKKGEYTQVGLQPGDYKLTATKDGYQGTYVTLHVGLGEPTAVPELKLVSAVAAQKSAGASSAGQISAAFKAAFELTQQGKLDEAEAAYKEILAKSPDIPEVHYNLGYLAGKKKDLAAAEAAYRKAVELKADYSDAWVALAETLHTAGQPDKAVDTLVKATADNPSDGKLQFGAGVFYFNTNRSSDALAAFKKAAELDAALAEVHYYLGTLAIGQNDRAGALASLEKYLASAPTNVQFKATAEGLVKYLKSSK